MIKRGLLLVTGLICLTFPVWAQDLLSNAEEFYRQGKFSQALNLYEQALKNHPNDPFVYYNIGNCYFKMGSKGLAAANYYRAFKLAPRDPDVRRNLSLTRTACGERLVPTGIPEIVHRAYFGLSMAELTGLLYALFWLCCLSLSVWLLKRKGAKITATLVLMTLLVFGWWCTRQKWENQPLAVIASPVAEIRSGPGTNFPASASLTQGHLLSVQDSKDNWYEVVVKSQGLKGWVEKSVVEKI